jgi:hypothetical protein
MVPKMLVISNQLTRLIAWEDSINIIRRRSFTLQTALLPLIQTLFYFIVLFKYVTINI